MSKRHSVQIEQPSPTPARPPATRRATSSRRQSANPPMPGFIDFQHPKSVAKPPSGSDWIHEIKFDGYRLQVRVEKGVPAIFIRNSYDWTDRFPELAADVARMAWRGFAALSAKNQEGRAGEAAGRRAVTSALGGPLRHRRRRHPTVCLRHEAGGDRLQALGRVLSRRRSESWVKSKCRASQEVVIGGWKQQPGGAFEGLMVGTYEGAKLVYAGRLKNGFGRGAEGLLGKLEALETAASPFEGGDPPRKTSEVHWVCPELVVAAEIAGVDGQRQTAPSVL